MWIYKITCLINNKIYIGLTKRVNPRKRLLYHFDEAFNRQSKCVLHAAMRKYGKDAFKFEVIDRADSYEELKEKEKFYIQQYNSYIRNNAGYNMTFGGEGSDSPKIISRYGKGKKRPKEHGEKISKALIGKAGTGRNAKGESNHLNKPVFARKIGQQEIVLFASAKIAAEELGIKTYGHINSVCKNKRLSTSGYVFWYEGDTPKMNDINEFTRVLNGVEITQKIGRWR